MDFALYREAIEAAFTSITGSVRDYLPSVTSAVALLLVGWLLAAVLRFVGVRIGRRFERLAPAPQVEGALNRIGLHRTLAEVVGGFIYWTVLLFFIAAATEALGLGVLTTWLSGLAYFLPRVVGAVLLLVAGVLAANLVRDAVLAATATANLSYGSALAEVTRAVVFIVTALIAVNELGIDLSILTVTLAVLLGATLGGVALAFGLGARAAVSNIIGSHYGRQVFRVGEVIRIDAREGSPVQGKILDITATSIVLKTAEGRVIVPAREFSEARLTHMTAEG